jgi:hypothetical protein
MERPIQHSEQHRQAVLTFWGLCRLTRRCPSHQLCLWSCRWTKLSNTSAVCTKCGSNSYNGVMFFQHMYNMSNTWHMFATRIMCLQHAYYALPTCVLYVCSTCAACCQHLTLYCAFQMLPTHNVANKYATRIKNKRVWSYGVGHKNRLDKSHRHGTDTIWSRRLRTTKNN